MLDLVDWLKSVEQSAHVFYGKSAEVFEEDEEFSTFLGHLADDERQHFHLMNKAVDYLRKSGIQVASDVALDPTIKDSVETRLKQGHESLSKGIFSKKQMIDLIVNAEYSELNELFLYALNTLKGHSKGFQRGAAVIQAHMDRIERFLTTLPDELQPRQDAHALPVVWCKRFLIVDDEEPLRTLLSRLLDTRGEVETVENGKEGLEKTRESFFDVIITDVDLPIMNGLEFFKQAAKADPVIQQHFLFYSGALTPAEEMYFQQNALPFLAKPFDVHEFLQAVDRIIKNLSESF